jgi:hypothetical protein
MESMESFKNFKGFVILYSYVVSLEKNGDKKNLLGITFFNYIDINLVNYMHYFPEIST